MMNCVLIVTNFNAGRKTAVKYKKKVLDFILKYTKSFKFADIDELHNIDVAPYDTIFAMGGDGTVNKILPFLYGTDKVLGIIPCGTANLFAAKLGLSMNLNKTLKIISQNNTKFVDILKINGGLCSLRCGFGYDSDIICKTPQSLKNKFGYFAYFIAGIIFALRLKKRNYEFDTDGKKFNTHASCVIIANAANMFKNIVSVGEKSELDDGITDIFILKTTNPILFFIEFLLITLNIKKTNSRAEYLKAKNVNITNSGIVCHIDGEKHLIKDNINISTEKSAIKVFSQIGV